VRYWPDDYDESKVHYIHNGQLVISFVQATKNKHYDVNELKLVKKSADDVCCYFLSQNTSIAI